MDLPRPFLERMKERLGSRFPAFLSSYGQPPRKGLRVNTLKLSAEEFRAISPFPLLPVLWAADGFSITEEKAGGDVYHFAGMYYLQEPSAMSVGEIAGSYPHERVLDLCAAPGGKTTHIAAKMAGRGILIANETDDARAKILSRNVERMGIANCAVCSAPPERLAERFGEYFDLILADAPCSGEGMFKKEPNAIPEWSEENVARCAVRQRGILDSAAKMLAAGGRLVYSTCTFAEEEDEWQVEDFLNRHPEFVLERQEKLYPHECAGEGHFCAVFRRTEGGERRPGPFPVRRVAAAERAFRAFSADFFTAPPEGEPTTLPDGRMYLVPRGMPSLGGTRLLRLGVELGEWDGKLFKPAHALCMAFGSDARRKLVLSRAEAERYLHGEALPADLPAGWCAVCVANFPLGLGKCVNGVVKNHLPKGLRKIV